MKRSSTSLLIVTLLATLSLQGCGLFGTNSANVYRSGEAQREQTVRMAVVETVRQIKIAGESNGAVGGLAGAALGALGGSVFGGGRGSLATGILGGVAGLAAGQAAESSLSKRDGLEITVRLDNGDLRAIVQDADENFKPGERVRLVSSGGKTRVTH